MYKSDPIIQSRLFRFLNPALSRVHAQRQIIVHDRFYLEGAYYRRLATYATLQFTKLQDFLNEESNYVVRNFFDERFKYDIQTYDLVCMLRCLFATSMARLCLIDDGVIWDADRIQPLIFHEEVRTDFDSLVSQRRWAKRV
jgi:hypothetical protein